MSRYIEHRVTEGERWDHLAWRYYGDAHRYEPIVAANPTVPIAAYLPSGIVVRIPILEPAGAATANLPPWKR